MQEVSVCRVYLCDLETGVKGALGAVAELGDYGIDIVQRHFTRRGKAFGKGDRTWRKGLPTALIRLERPPATPRSISRCLAPGVGELDSGNRSLFEDEFGDRDKCLSVSVRPDTTIIRADPALATDRSRLHHDEGCAAHGTAPQVHQVPVRGHAVLARILAHGRDE